MEEVRSTFLGFYEKRLRLQLLVAELAALEDWRISAFVSKSEDIESKYSLVTFETRTIESIVAVRIRSQPALQLCFPLWVSFVRL